MDMLCCSCDGCDGFGSTRFGYIRTGGRFSSSGSASGSVFDDNSRRSRCHFEKECSQNDETKHCQVIMSGHSSHTVQQSLLGGRGC